MTEVAASADEDLERETIDRPTTLRGALIGAVAALLAIGVFAAGWWVARPTYPSDLSPDAGFARDMQTHHGQAVDMSLTIRSAGAKTDVSTLAYDIVTTQENQRGQMRGWLETWGLPAARSEDPMAWMARAGHGHAGGGPMLLADGRMPGMAAPDQIRQLRTLRGTPAEIRYLQLMIPHHRSGVDMARACVASCTEPDVVSLARTMVLGQQAEITLMISQLRTRGVEPV